MKFANESMSAESIFFYMTHTSLLLSPFAIPMTFFSEPVNWGLEVSTWQPYFKFRMRWVHYVIYAYRYGKAIVVSPLTNAVIPVITIIISLILYAVLPGFIIFAGMVLAVTSIFLLAFAEESNEKAEEVVAGTRSAPGYEKQVGKP